MNAVKSFFSSLEAKDWIALAAATFSMCSATAAAVSATMSWRNTSATLEKLNKDETSEIEFQLTDFQFAGMWEPTGNDPNLPAFSASPILQLVNLGPKTAKRIHVVFDLETPVPDQIGAQTGVRSLQAEPMPTGPRTFRLFTGRNEFTITHVDNYGHLTPVRTMLISRHIEVDPVDFLVPDKGIEVALPIEIRNEMFVYLLFEYLLRYGSSHLNNAAVASQLSQPILSVMVEWLYPDGKTIQRAKGKWELIDPLFECRVQGHDEFYNLVNAVESDIPNGGLNPEWTALRFRGSLRRIRLK